MKRVVSLSLFSIMLSVFSLDDHMPPTGVEFESCLSSLDSSFAVMVSHLLDLDLDLVSHVFCIGVLEELAV
jgi:hypothetical protein